MAGVTDLPFRLICKEYGADGLTTEMVSAKGLYYKDKKTARLMHLDKREKPAAIQIFGSDPDIMGEIAPIVESFGAARIDINMGCPMPKIVNNGDGSALMKDPAILILDDTTSAVDMETETRIQEELDQITSDKTTFIIAHRVSSVKEADEILIMAHGKIVERGTHDSLLAKKGYYYDVYNKQLGNFGIEMGGGS